MWETAHASDPAPHLSVDIEALWRQLGDWLQTQGVENKPVAGCGPAGNGAPPSGT